MKKQLLACAILICNLGFSQQMHLKSYTYEYEVGTDLLSIYTLYYTDDFSLDSMVLHDQYDNVYGTYKFENERIIEMNYGSEFIFWKYFEGYVQEYAVEYCDTILQNTYFLNENYQVFKYTLDHFIMEYNWSNGNLSSIMTENIIAHDTTWDYMFYDETILNPWYESNKFFRRDYRGSVNFIKNLKSAVFTVQETINNYPKLVIQEVNGQIVGTYTFDYYIIGEIPENNFDLVVISTTYYNELGQNIGKPKQGFYIERKLTNKGVICNKCYVK